MKYLIKVTHTYTTHNSLEQEIQEFIKQIDRVLFFGHDVEKIKRVISGEINAICEQNKRCKAIIPYWHNYGPNDSDWTMFLTGICSFSILKISNKELVEVRDCFSRQIDVIENQDETARET